MQSILDSIDWSIVAAIASAIAAISSASAALVANKISRLSLRPELVGRYDIDTDMLYIMNVGKGSALNISLQATNLYFTDIKEVFQFTIEKNSNTNIYVDQEIGINVEMLSRKTKRNNGLDIEAYFLTHNVGKHTYIGIIFNDSTGKRMITHLKSKFDKSTDSIRTIESIKTRPYGLASRGWDILSTKWYLLLVRLREWGAAIPDKLLNFKSD